MLQNIYSYAKCCFANKATLMGYSLLIGIGATKLLENQIGVDIDTDLAEFTAVILLTLTKVGFETYQIYKKTNKHIEEHNTISHRYLEKFDKSPYCTQKGLELSAKENGLEDILESNNVILEHKKANF